MESIRLVCVLLFKPLSLQIDTKFWSARLTRTLTDFVAVFRFSNFELIVVSVNFAVFLVSISFQFFYCDCELFRERSAVSHSITWFHHIYAKRVEIDGALAYAITGMCWTCILCGTKQCSFKVFIVKLLSLLLNFLFKTTLF